ncbi:bifunctional diaminohydroxyphosphoribosylaminopyrimidine deaminase/5-amino-6-(5-phosphoribosylamino)uracil reductase RibD [Halioxenophilus aromaticivorans]|uniref:Riboflavin biosynthesis protein RibD n=1 Tax=Halioxenophilus aromaticivorans TaxID=1306992 RepID=A0AAV3U9H3_9ALTE
MPSHQPSTDTLDAQYMTRALGLARLGLNTTSPNPRVGCVLVVDDEVIGEGFHVAAGGPHAEINALNSVTSANRSRIRGATAYVTLEPCSHHGRTGPCCEALATAGVDRVVFGCEDANPSVSGRGLAYLRSKGIAVAGPVLEAEAAALNPGFNARMCGQRPYVRVKLAMSLDGRTAMASGESQWITGSAARAQVQALRARSCAVISGHSTVALDQARLNVRADQLPASTAQMPAGHPVYSGVRQPLRVVLDGQGGLTGQEPLFQTPGPILWVTGHGPAIERENVDLLALPGQSGRVNLPALLQALAQRQCNEVLVEAGPTLAGQFVAQGLVDELIVFMAPVLMGSAARPLLQLPIETMAGKHHLQITDIRAVGSDWQITAKPQGAGSTGAQ